MGKLVKVTKSGIVLEPFIVQNVPCFEKIMNSSWAGGYKYYYQEWDIGTMNATTLQFWLPERVLFQIASTF